MEETLMLLIGIGLVTVSLVMIIWHTVVDVNDPTAKILKPLNKWIAVLSLIVMMVYVINFIIFSVIGYLLVSLAWGLCLLMWIRLYNTRYIKKF